MKKSILYKEKTNKMYWVMLCVLLVSGAIVCSTNDNDNDNGNGDGNGGGNGDPLMFACPNGTAFTPTEDNRPIVAGVENCTECTAGFTLEAVRGSNRMVCRTPYVCSNGVAEIGTANMANVENCASCDTTAGFMLQAVPESDRMVCRIPFACPNGTEVTPTEDNMPTAAGEVNCASCNEGFGPEDVDSGARTICNALPIALWNAGTFQGNFGGLGFALCQTRLDDTNDTIGSELTTRGYTKAVFFGSTGTGAGDYLFINIGSDIDALALPATGGVGSPVSVSDRNIEVFTVSSGSVNVINMFGAPAMARTLMDVTDVAAGGGWQNGGADVVVAAGVGSSISYSAWSFTEERGVYSTDSCTGATSTSASQLGLLMSSDSVDSEVDLDDYSRSSCDSMRFVLCVAR